MTDGVVDVREGTSTGPAAMVRPRGSTELNVDKVPPRALVTRWPDGGIRQGAALTAERHRQVLRLAAIVRDLTATIKARDVNLSALARRVGVNRSTVGRILNGEQWPSFTVLEGLAHDLGVSLLPDERAVNLNAAERARD